MAMRPRSFGASDNEPPAPTLEELQSLSDAFTGGELRLRDPVWLTHFRLHHRQAERYRTGRIFLAGDAAHVHSPAGAQGMNTGIQDAWNLGWKLALVSRGAAHPVLLDSYEPERLPVGRFVLRDQLLLCGPAELWDEARLGDLCARYRGGLSVHRLAREPIAGGLHDGRGEAWERLGVKATAHYLVRPDGYVGYRCAGTDLGSLERHLARWLVSSPSSLRA